MGGGFFDKENYTYLIVSNTVSSTSYEDVTITNTGNGYTYTVVYNESSNNEDFEKIKELIRKEAILKVKESWNIIKNEFKPIPPIRPEIQLRGVCYGGRGWA
jgi:hypothetical protein